MILHTIIIACCVGFIFNAFAMQKRANYAALALIAGTAHYENKSEMQTQWCGLLNNGKSIIIDVFHKTRRTRHTKKSDMFHWAIKGRIDKKRLTNEQAENWYKCLADSCPASFVFELS